MLVRSKVTLGRCSGFQLQTNTTLSLCSHPERILLLLDQLYLPVVPVVLNSGCSWIPALCLIYFPFLKTISKAYYWKKLLPDVISLLSVKIMAIMLLLGLDSPPVGADLGVEVTQRRSKSSSAGWCLEEGLTKVVRLISSPQTGVYHPSRLSSVAPVSQAGHTAELSVLHPGTRTSFPQASPALQFCPWTNHC